MKKIALITMFFGMSVVSAQVGINTTSPDAQFDVKSSNQATPANTDGILIPRIDRFPAVNPTAAQQGMLVYLTTAWLGNQPGFYWWDNTITTWKPISGSDGGTLDEAYDFGGAGSGKTITADAGAVNIVGSDGLQVTGTYGSGADIALSDAGTRMFFNPKKAAFRAGTVTGTQWNNFNVGTYSTAFGYNNTASGNASTAMGHSNIASANVSTAIGSSTIASGNTSTAMGHLTTASGYISTAMGIRSIASGFVSTAIGYEVTASGTTTIAIGEGLLARSNSEIAIGRHNTDYTPNSAFIWDVNDRLFVIGNGTANNARSDALIMLKTGLTRLPSTTNAMIDAADGKAVVTKEYLQANSGGTLDHAYDFGGAGAGKTITADAGAVNIAGNGGLTVNRSVGIGTTNPNARLDLAQNLLIRQNVGNTVLAEITTNVSEKGISVQQAISSSSWAYSGTIIPAWQSFTATESLDSFTLALRIGNVTADSSPRTITIYEGTGTSGTILGTAQIYPPADGWVYWVETPTLNISLTAGSVYTIAINDRYWWSRQTGNVYLDGTSSDGTNFDYTFIIYKKLNHIGTTPFRIVGESGTPAFFNMPEEDSKVYVNGRVGIGTSTPQAPLHVTGVANTTNAAQIRYFNSNTVNIGYTPSWLGGTVAYFEGNVIASVSFISAATNVFSDARIKNSKGISDSKSDLQTLAKIQITDYTMKDSLKDTKEYKKVIAQQVEKVYPQAINKMTKEIPNIYKLAEINNGWVNLKTDLQQGDKVKLIFENKEDLYEVKEVSENGFKVVESLPFDENGRAVFVYGKEVNDFRTVDYDSLSMLNISATQELLKMLNKANEKIQDLETKVQQIDELKADIEMLKEFIGKTDIHLLQAK
ncbi:MAG: tail fiber domain-containing protein [Flavobacteriaceae bacterium]|jgi:hypothetical protein|nr:tail fiber domain-containing protein [Flavobacteriaceae bacterium]